MSRIQFDLIMILLTCVQPMVVSGPSSTHMLLTRPLEPLRRQEGHPQRTLLVPTRTLVSLVIMVMTFRNPFWDPAIQQITNIHYMPITC